jgi:hypothetical protein
MACLGSVRLVSDVPKTTVPDDWRAEVERFAKRRAKQVGLAWDEIGEAHRADLMRVIWAEMNWHE